MLPGMGLIDGMAAGGLSGSSSSGATGGMTGGGGIHFGTSAVGQASSVVPWLVVAAVAVLLLVRK